MNRVVSLVGSARGCKFRLTDPSVSAFHAGLIRTPSGLWVVDLRGGRSIIVNAEPVRFAPLADGDVLGVGRYRLRIRCREATAAGQDPGGPSSAGWPPSRPAGALARRPAAAPAISPAIPAFGGSMMPMPPPPIPVVASAAGVELVTADVSPSPRLHPELADSVLVPLVNQFGMMQQQMFDQFQQAMGMLVQMFTSMHRDQMDVIREELDRLHVLSRELQELKEELARSHGPAGGSAAPAPAAPSRPAAVVDPEPPPSAAPAAEGPMPSASAGPQRPSPPFVVPPPRPTAPPPPPPAGPRPDQRPPDVDATGAVAAPQDAVAWIHRRIAAIQAERETRWQKILKILPGMS
jgi:hypothetical protein